MTTLNTYIYKNNGATATIENKETYWSLSVSSNNSIVLLHDSLKIWNTKRAAKSMAINILNQY